MSRNFTFVHVPGLLVKSRYHKKQVSNTDPNVRTEGNVLWMKLVKMPNDDDKKRLDGSIYAYYKHLAEYLKFTPYDEAYNYCVKELEKLPEEEVAEDKYLPYLYRTAVF